MPQVKIKPDLNAQIMSGEFSSTHTVELRCSGCAGPTQIYTTGNLNSWRSRIRESGIKGSSVWAHTAVGARATSEGFCRLTQVLPSSPHMMNIRTVSGAGTQGQSMLNLLKLPHLPQIRIQNTTAKPLFTSRQLQYQAITWAIVLKITLQCTQIRYFTTPGLKLALHLYT